MRLKIGQIEIEADSKAEIEELLKLAQAQGGTLIETDEAASSPRAKRGTAVPLLHIPKKGERVRRTREEMAIDEERMRKHQKPLSLPEIQELRKKRNEQALVGETRGGQTFDLDLEHVPENNL